MRVELFGVTKDGEQASLYELKNDLITCHVTDYGTSLIDLYVLNREEKSTDVVLGFDTLSSYENDTESVGCNVGRHANRISGASFILNGKKYELDKNDDGNNLHSGKNPYSKRIWEVYEYEDTKITFSLMSENMDQGFPGKVVFFITYCLEGNTLTVSYRGTPSEDTLINMTNHSYFNLNGQGEIYNHKVCMEADYYTPISENMIPTGEIEAVEGTPMDFRNWKAIGQEINSDFNQLKIAKGYDHNFCIRNYDGNLKKIAKVCSEISGIVMTIYSDNPGVQMYTANFLNCEGKRGERYQPHDAVCFEPQFFPDAINHSNFASPICKGKECYQKKIRYEFAILGRESYDHSTIL